MNKLNEIRAREGNWWERMGVLFVGYLILLGVSFASGVAAVLLDIDMRTLEAAVGFLSAVAMIFGTIYMMSGMGFWKGFGAFMILRVVDLLLLLALMAAGLA